METSAILVPESTASKTIKASLIFSLHFGHYRNIRTSVAFATHARNALEALLRDFPTAPGLKTRFDAIGRQLDDGGLDSVRWFEIKALHAGKASLGSSVAYFDRFVPQTRLLCDPIYAAHEDATALRPTYHDASISLLRMIFDTCKNVHLSQGMTVGASVLDNSLLSGDLLSSLVADSANKAEVDLPDAAVAMPHRVDLPVVGEAATEGEIAVQKAMAVDVDAAEEEDASSKQKVEVEADDCCEICGYRPKGDPKWFRGSMAKHRLTKHSVEVIYKCPFPKCTSQYRNRPDNLRQHQLEKDHFVGDEAPTKKSRKQSRQQQQAGSGDGDGGDETSTRPAKKRKTSR